jgi:hypothetical protein
MSILTAEARRRLKPSDFVFPARKAYPIHDAAHARDALARSSGKPEAAAVRAAVKKKYPSIDVGESKESAAEEAAESPAKEKQEVKDGQESIRKMYK